MTNHVNRVHVLCIIYYLQEAIAVPFASLLADFREQVRKTALEHKSKILCVVQELKSCRYLNQALTDSDIIYVKSWNDAL